MKTKFFLLIILFVGCKSFNKDEQTHVVKKDFQKNIRFNHLFVVIDDSTYNYLFDSLKILDGFSFNSEQTIESGEESWTGKYLIGKHHYLEIFNPEGYEKAKFGEIGLGFMTDKSGTLDSIRHQWERTKDSVSFTNEEMILEGQSYPWAYFLSIPNLDSSRVIAFLMENQKEEMMRVGFSEEDLQQVISWAEYVDHSTAISEKISPDSVKFEKAFSRITDLHLTLTPNELEWLKKTLLDFGFTEDGNNLVSQDINIKYKISQNKGFILNQIDFELMDSLNQGTYRYKNLEFTINENSAHLSFLYNSF